jgi:hypothetical protein
MGCPGPDFKTPAMALGAALEKAATLSREPWAADMRLTRVSFGQRSVGERGFYYVLDFVLSIENGGPQDGSMPQSWTDQICKAWEKKFQAEMKPEPEKGE